MINTGPNYSKSKSDFPVKLWNNQDGNIAHEDFYQDKESPWPSSRIQIPSDLIEGDVLKVFIPVRIEMEDSLKKFMRYDSISKIDTDSVNIGQYYLENMNQFYQLTVEDTTFRTKAYFQKVTSTNQKGYVTYLNIGFLEEGLYELILKGPDEMYEKPFATVPFYKTD